MIRNSIKTLVLMLLPVIAGAQVSGLAGWNIFVDPGHSQNENMPGFSWGISEAKRNLRVALHLKDMLMNETDIDTVYLSRTDDFQSVSLSQRSSRANQLNTYWFHSIHSDAGAAGANSTLLLWGGWRKNGQTVEKTPNGGHAMSVIMVDLLTRGMRTTTRGDYADRTFYEGFPLNHTNQYPYLHVNRETIMASELSESGFHTNPTQNQLFMNNDWLRLEARTFFWSILDFHQIPRPPVKILTGIVSDVETGKPLNGAVVTAADRQYTTDTYESLFYQYTSDPELLSNGFYYFENMDYDSVDVRVEVENYYPDTVRVAVSQNFFTFNDFKLVSSILPYLVYSEPADGDTAVSILDDIVLEFSRPMNRALVESLLVITPEIPVNFFWTSNNTRLILRSDSLQFLTTYRILLPGTITDQYNHAFDGNADGVGGDSLTIEFTTGMDVYPPQVTAFYPVTYQKNVELRPVVSMEFDEQLDDASINGDVFFIENYVTKEKVPGLIKHYVVEDRSVLNFFPDENLSPNTLHITRLYPGVADRFGNATTNYKSISFTTAETDQQVQTIDALEAGFSANWWQPSHSGSTTGILAETAMAENADIVNELTGSSSSLQLNYVWDLNAGGWMIREYLVGGAPKNVTFDTTYTLQCYVFGDGSNTLFRFALDDKVPDAAAVNHEVSKWIPIDWIGWRKVEWDLGDPNSVGEWLGDGTLDGTLRFDSFQFAYQPGAAVRGTIYIDDLQLVKSVPTSIETPPVADKLPTNFHLAQNYPNPFNPTTEIHFAVPERVHVKISVYNTLGQLVKTLLSEEKNPGHYQIRFDASDLASGVYLYRIVAGDFVQTRKMNLIK